MNTKKTKIFIISLFPFFMIVETIFFFSNQITVGTLLIKLTIIFICGVITYITLTNLLKSPIPEQHEDKNNEENDRAISNNHNISLLIDTLSQKLGIPLNIDSNNGWINDNGENWTLILEKINEIPEIELLQKIPDIIRESENTGKLYYKIPFIIKLLTRVISQTEDAAMTLIEKIDVLSSECSQGRQSLKSIYNKIGNDNEGSSFNDIIAQSHEVMSQYNTLIDSITKINSENSVRLGKISDWVDKISSILENINDISEKNHIISINSSIEAARLGESGKGFNILANEIRSLTEKTENLTREIETIISGFKTYGDTLIKELTGQAENIIDNVKNASQNTEKIVSVLINSYENISTSVSKSASSSTKVSDSLNKVLVSLQFQDITRQQIESIIAILQKIQNDVFIYTQLQGNQGSNISNFDLNIINSVKNEIIKDARHFDSEQLKNDFKEVSNEISSDR